MDDLDGLIAQTLEATGRRRRIFPLRECKAALIVVDMQSCFCDEGAPLEMEAAREIIPNINRLAEAFRDAGAPVFWLKQAFLPSQADVGLLPLFHRASPRPGNRDAPLVGLQSDSSWSGLVSSLDRNEQRDFVVEKSRYSPFTPGSSRLDSILRTLGIETVVITGAATNVCCEATARDAMMYDYGVVLVEDAMATTDERLHRISLLTLQVFFGDVATTDECVKEISVPVRPSGSA